MNTKHLFLVLAVFLGALASGQGQAQTIFTENFTDANTTNQWYFFNGACLTAGTSTSTTSPGLVPGCATVRQTTIPRRRTRILICSAGTAAA
jgi:hypothetical protein